MAVSGSMDLRRAASLLERVGSAGRLARVWEEPIGKDSVRLTPTPAGGLLESDFSSVLRIRAADSGARTSEVDLGEGTWVPMPAPRPDGSFTVARGDRLVHCAPDGTVDWDVSLGQPLNARCAVGPEGNAYVYGKDSVFAVGPDGTLLWSRPHQARNGVDGPAVTPDGKVVVASREGPITAFDATGQEVWRNVDLTRASEYSLGPLASDLAVGPEGQVYFGAWDRKLHALGSDGRSLWQAELKGDPLAYATPEVDGAGNVYCRGGGSRDALYGFDPQGRSLFSPRDYASVTALAASPVAGVVVYTAWKGLEVLDPRGQVESRHEWSATLSSPAVGWDGTIYTVENSRLLALLPPRVLAEREAVEPMVPAGEIRIEARTVSIGGVDLPVRG